MSVSNSLLSPVALLNEQIARQIFDLMPEGGPVMIIMDREGHCWPSDSEQFSRLNLGKTFLKELCGKVDDGTEPIVTQVNDCSVVAAQLATEQTNCGYVLLAMPQYSPESTLVNIDLIEIVLSQISLIAKLIEKNNLLYELQIKQFGVYSSSEIPSN
jgi:hypothetical protein